MRFEDSTSYPGWLVSRAAIRFERWRALGRLLPVEVRERVFDPAFSDLMYAWLSATDEREVGVPFGMRVIGTYVGCIPISVPRLFYSQGRLTRFGRITVWSAMVLIAAAVVVVRMSQKYAAYG